LTTISLSDIVEEPIVTRQLPILKLPSYKDEVVMSRRSHSKSEIEAALAYAEQNSWRVELGGSHAWGKIYCPYNDKECRCGIFCITSIWSTPKNAGNHAKQIRRVIDNCTKHNSLDNSGEEEE
jgi:SOS response regulatory protein OraA/RecX